MKQMSFVMACKTFFGFKAGQTLHDFNAELKALTPADRAELTELFTTVGIEVVDKAAAAAA